MLNLTTKKKRDDHGIEVIRRYGPTATCARQSGLGTGRDNEKAVQIVHTQRN